MRRQTAIRLYALLVIVQVLSICAGLIEMVTDPTSQLRQFLPASLIGISQLYPVPILEGRQEFDDSEEDEREGHIEEYA